MSASATAVKALWGIDGATVVEFNASQIGSGTVNPIHQFSISDPNFPLLYGMTFDRTGDLWIAEGNQNINSMTNNYTGRILEYSVAQLATLAVVPSPAPVTTLTLAGAGYELAFDATGNLWASVVSFNNGGQLEEFVPAQYASSGSPTPSVTIGAAQDPGGLVFGSDGTLWLSPTKIFGPSGGVLNGYAATQLAGSGSPTPAYTLNANAPNPVLGGELAIVSTPNQVIFDASGNLWSIFNGFAFEYAAGALHGAGTSPTAGFQVYPGESNGGQTEIIPGYAIAFDSSSDLVTNSLYNNSMSSANVLHYFASGAYSGSAPASSSATFGSSVPALDGTHVGNLLVAGPYVP